MTTEILVEGSIGCTRYIGSRGKKNFILLENEATSSCGVKREFEKFKEEREWSNVSHLSIIKWRCFRKYC